MKHLKIIFKVLRGVLTVLLLTSFTPVAADEIANSEMDSVEISLLTCKPHDEVYSLYGHTAIRYHDLRPGGIDVAFNYGVFNFHAPYFVLRFVFGITDYELGVYSYHLFQREYKSFGSEVTEQVLNLTNEEKMKLRLALAENMLPENKIYRYNYFYNNCTTKARDIIEQSIIGRIEYSENEHNTTTYRKAIHAMTSNNPWSRFGNDLLLGLKADLPTTMRQQEFLPANLMNDFNHAQILASDGGRRPLVKTLRIAVPAGTQTIQEGFPLTPWQCAFVFLIISVCLFVIEFKQKRAFLWWDLLLMLITGTFGIVLFLMLFSQHPTVSLNLQFLLLNPLPWLFLWPVYKGAREKGSQGERSLYTSAVRPIHKSREAYYWYITVFLSVTFLIGSIFQHYAEGIIVLALSLLLQSYIHLKKSAKCKTGIQI
ncbi:MAG: DUF4105 domain-containing protein [Prevotella sp.]|nr:DUF4105 domain-containing protein [Prevotella sp.]